VQNLVSLVIGLYTLRQSNVLLSDARSSAIIVI